MLNGIRERWRVNGATRAVTWKDQRRALLVGGFSLLVAFLGIGGTLLQFKSQADARVDSANSRTAEAQYQADRATYENARDEKTRCDQRVESSAKIASIASAVDAGFRSVDATFDRIIGIVEQGPNASAFPGVPAAREAVNELSDQVADVSEATAQYAPADPKVCEALVVPPPPTLPR